MGWYDWLTNADCVADGNRCTQIAAGTRACTTGCVDDTGCPADYACKPIGSTTPRAATTLQCVPRAGACQ